MSLRFVNVANGRFDTLLTHRDSFDPFRTISECFGQSIQAVPTSLLEIPFNVEMRVSILLIDSATLFLDSLHVTNTVCSRLLV